MGLPATTTVPDVESMIQRARYASVRRAFESDAELAEAFGVNRSAVAHWKRGGPIGPENWELLQALDTTVGLLGGFLNAATIPKWLRGVNGFLDNRRPLDVLRTGRLSEVVRAIEAERSEAFA
jgi:hypothetical protein